MNIRSNHTFSASSLPQDIVRRRWSGDEVLAMVRAGILGEDDHIELIDGEIVAMSPKGNRHEIVRSELLLYWSDRRPPHIKFAVEPVLRLDPNNNPEPDLILFPASLLVPEVRADTVTLVVEVADSSLSYDLMIKAPLYAAFGVREYWVINAKTLEATIHRDPAPEGYRTITRHAAAEQVAPMDTPALALRLADLRME